MRKSIRVSIPLFLGLALLRTASADVPRVLDGVDLGSQEASVHETLSQAPKATVVLFLSAKCPCSGSHEAILSKLYGEFHSKGFEFVGIHSNVDESVALSRKHFESAHLPFPVIQDDGAKLADAFGAFKTPHAYVINPSGEILFQGGVTETHNGPAAKKHYLQDALSSVVAGKIPEPSEVRVLGCIIKRN